MLRKRALMVTIVSIFVLLVGVLPTFAGEVAEADAVIEGCQVAVSFYMPLDIQTERAPAKLLHRRGPGGTTVDVQMWDDGNLLHTQTVTGSVEELITVYFPIDQLYIAEDVGFYVIDPETSYVYYANDPFIITDETADPCIQTLTLDCPYPPQPLLGQGRVIGPVTTYFAPSLSAGTNPPVVLAVGTSWWILEARDGFYKLFIACQGRYVWVTAESLGANFDVVWNGRPLPDAGSQSSR